MHLQLTLFLLHYCNPHYPFILTLPHIIQWILHPTLPILLPIVCKTFFHFPPSISLSCSNLILSSFFPKFRASVFLFILPQPPLEYLNPALPSKFQPHPQNDSNHWSNIPSSFLSQFTTSLQSLFFPSSISLLLLLFYYILATSLWPQCPDLYTNPSQDW